MIIKITRKSKKKDIDNALKKIRPKRKKMDLHKYFGKVDFGVSGLTYQKKLRNEWK